MYLVNLLPPPDYVQRIKTILCIAKYFDNLKPQDLHNIIYILSRLGIVRDYYGDWRANSSLGVRSNLLDIDIAFMVENNILREINGYLKPFINSIECSDIENKLKVIFNIGSSRKLLSYVDKAAKIS